MFYFVKSLWGNYWIITVSTLSFRIAPIGAHMLLSQASFLKMKEMKTNYNLFEKLFKWYPAQINTIINARGRHTDY